MDRLSAFAPQLWILNGVRDVDFYIPGLGSRRIKGVLVMTTVQFHVSELSGSNGAVFHLHEEGREFTGIQFPARNRGTTA